MASIRKNIRVGASSEKAWDALRDFGAVHERVAPGFVTDSRVDGQDRIVTFVTGAVARERLVSLDDDRRRLVYSVTEGPLGLVHHQSSVEVLEGTDGPGCRLIWTTDLLPDDAASVIESMMEQGAATIARTLSN
jgi:hypothetical protein